MSRQLIRVFIYLGATIKLRDSLHVISFQYSVLNWLLYIMFVMFACRQNTFGILLSSSFGNVLVCRFGMSGNSVRL